MTVIALPNNQTLDINYNRNGLSYKLYEDGIHKLGLISDNPGIDNCDNSDYYEEVKKEYKTTNTSSSTNTTTRKQFKNKIRVKLIDNNYLTAHLIHWVPNDGYFFVTQDKFWDKFDNKNNNNLDEKPLPELNNKITPPFPPE